MSHSPRPAFRPSLLRALFSEEEDAKGRLSRETRDTMEVDAEHELLPDDDHGHAVATHIHHPHHPESSPPATTEVVATRPKRGGGLWVAAGGALLLLAPILFGPRRPEAAAAAQPPPRALAGTPTSATERDAHELAIRFALAREPGDGLDAQRELALDPVVLKSPPARAPSHAAGQGKSSFDEGAALAAVRNAGLGSAQCGESAAGATVVSVTFAPSGRVTRALVEDGPLQGTLVGGCIARHLRAVTVPPFEGDFRTVKTDVTLR